MLEIHIKQGFFVDNNDEIIIAEFPITYKFEKEEQALLLENKIKNETIILTEIKAHLKFITDKLTKTRKVYGMENLNERDITGKARLENEIETQEKIIAKLKEEQKRIVA